MRLTTTGMVAVGSAKFVHADDIVELVPIDEDGRGDGHQRACRPKGCLALVVSRGV